MKNGAVPQSEVDEAQANFEAAQLELEQAELSFQERQVIALFDGIVGIPQIDPGDRVTPDMFITGLDNREILHIDFEVPESLTSALVNAQKNQQPIVATTPSYPGRKFMGTITAQESRVNSATRTLTARASIRNDDELLKPGMSFKTLWKIPGDSYATTPEISLQWSREGSYVWIIRDSLAKKVMARVIARKAGQVLLEGEIEEGELVVVEGVQRLRPDAKVDIIN